MAEWTERLIQGEGGDRALVGADEIPETLLPMMRRHLGEHLPVLETTRQQFEGWLETAEDGAELPRAFGTAPFTQGGKTGNIITNSFALFRLQAALDIYDGMDAETRGRADDLLEAIGGADLKSFKLPARLERRNYKLHLAL